MKKTLVLSNVITAALLGILLLKSCSMPQNEETESAKQSSDLKSTQIVLDYSGDTTFKSLTIPQAAQLKSNFLKNLHPAIKGVNQAVYPTEYIQYNLEDLKNLIWYIEYYAKATGKPINAGDLGVNVHFGQFPQDLSGFKHLKDLTDQERKDLAGKQMIYFMPTIKLSSGKRMEFNPKLNYRDMKSGKIKDFVSLKDHHGNELADFKLVDYPHDSPAMDFGGYRPPPMETGNDN